jgi:hypothetical protein
MYQWPVEAGGQVYHTAGCIRWPAVSDGQLYQMTAVSRGKQQKTASKGQGPVMPGWPSVPGGQEWQVVCSIRLAAAKGRWPTTVADGPATPGGRQ